MTFKVMEIQFRGLLSTMRSSPRGAGGGGGPCVDADDSAGAVQGDAPIFSSYSENKCPKRRPYTPGQRRLWLRDVERGTRPFRTRRALEALAKAQAAEWERNYSKSRWYRVRAKGQHNRFEVVSECGHKEVVLRCEDCGHEGRRVTAFCGKWRLCLPCRARRGQQYRKRFRHGRAAALARLRFRLEIGGQGGRWGEKFLTLTLPHSGDVVRDLKTLPKAWRWFWKRLREHFVLDRGMSAAAVADLVYVRVIEVTAGQLNDGHAHLHVYLITPYLHHEVLGLIWARAIAIRGYQAPTRPLAEVLGRDMEEWRRAQLREFLVTRRGPGAQPLDPVPHPIDHIETCYGDIEYELVKYLVKDAVQGQDGETELVAPEFYTRAYEGMEGLKTVQTSRRFWETAESKSCGCEKCGSAAVTRRIEPAKPQPEEPVAWSAMDRPPAEWSKKDD